VLVEEKPDEAQRVLDEVLVEQAFPARDGEIRRIHHLWGPCYRLDFHQTQNANYIGRSYFVLVRGVKVEVLG
jgi:hypothetical protein